MPEQASTNGAVASDVPDHPRSAVAEAHSQTLSEEQLDEYFLLLDSDSFPTETYLVGGLLAIPYRELVAWVGDGGVGKSYLSLDLAVSVAIGKPFLGQPVKQGIVLYLDFEQGRRVTWNRLGKLTREAGINHQSLQGSFHYRNYQTRGMTLFDMAQELRELVAAIRPDLIIVDGWASAFQISSNDDDQVLAAFSVLKPLLNWGTVLYLTHPSDAGAAAAADKMKPAGNRHQRNQPRRVYGLKALKGLNRLQLGISKSNDTFDQTKFTLERVDTHNGTGLKHVMVPSKRSDKADNDGPRSFQVDISNAKTPKPKPMATETIDSGLAVKVALRQGGAMDLTHLYKAVGRLTNRSPETVRERLSTQNVLPQLRHAGEVSTMRDPSDARRTLIQLAG